MKRFTSVHAAHCCRVHGCKYGDGDCPVALGTIKQKFPCDVCDDDVEIPFTLPTTAAIINDDFCF
jgi:hypothetical protein